LYLHNYVPPIVWRSHKSHEIDDKENLNRLNVVNGDSSTTGFYRPTEPGLGEVRRVFWAQLYHCP
jgi:hypothetical protein